MTLLFCVNFVVFKKQFWKWQFSVKSEAAPTISLFKNASARSFKNQKQISGIWIFDFFSFCMIMYMLISQSRSENPRNLIFLQTWFEKISEDFWLQSSKLFWPFPCHLQDPLFFPNNSAPTEIFNVLKVIPALRTARTRPFFFHRFVQLQCFRVLWLQQYHCHSRNVCFVVKFG